MTRHLTALLLLAGALSAGSDVDALVSEYKRKRTDVDRRFAIVKELGALRHSEASAALFDLARGRRTAHPLECVLQLAPSAGPATVTDLIQWAKRDTRTALPDLLGLALPTVIDAEAGPWVIEKGLVARNPAIKLACIRALGAWGTAEARAPLLERARAELKRRPGRRDAELLYECARALRAIGGEGVDALLAACASDPDWRARLAVAGDALVLDPHPVVRWASIEKATKAAGADLVALLRHGGSRTRALAKQTLIRVATVEQTDWDLWCRAEKLQASPESGALAPLPVRVLFLVDISLQMAGPPDVVPTRIDAARREVRELLRTLPADALVNLATVGSIPQVWNREYLPANEARVQDHLDRIEPRGNPLYRHALDAVFRHPQPPHVVHVVAGWPDDLTEPAALQAALHRLNRLHRAVFHTVAVHHGPGAATQKLETMLRRLAAQTGGTFRSLGQPTVKLR